MNVGDVVSLYFENTIQTGTVELKQSDSQIASTYVELPTGAILKVLSSGSSGTKYTLHNNSTASFILENGFTSDWENFKTAPVNLSVEKRRAFENHLSTVSTEIINKTVEKMLSDMCSILEDQSRHRKRKKSNFPMKRWTEEEENILIKTYSTLVQNGHCRTSDILKHLSNRLNRSMKAVDLRMQSLRKDCKLLPLGNEADLYEKGFAFPKTRKTKSEIAARNFMKRWTVEEDKILIGFYNRCRANRLKFSGEVAKIAKLLDRTDNSVSLRVIGLKKKFPKSFIAKPSSKDTPEILKQANGNIFSSLSSLDEIAKQKVDASIKRIEEDLANSPVSNALFKSYADLMRAPVSPDSESRSNRKGTTWKKWTEFEEEVLVNAINNKPYHVSTNNVMESVAKQLGRSTMATTLRLNHLRRKRPFLFKNKKLSRAHVKDEVYSVINDLLNQVEGLPIGVKRPYDSLDFSSPKKRRKSRFEDEIDLSDYENWLNRQKEAVQFSHVFPLIPVTNWNKVNSLDTPTF